MKRYSCENPPPKIKGWNHSKQVLVWYKGNPEIQTTDRYGIAYYHYDPPFSKPCWVNFNDNGIPDYWWDLPEVKD